MPRATSRACCSAPTEASPHPPTDPPHGLPAVGLAVRPGEETDRQGTGQAGGVDQLVGVPIPQSRAEAAVEAIGGAHVPRESQAGTVVDERREHAHREMPALRGIDEKSTGVRGRLEGDPAAHRLLVPAIATSGTRRGERLDPNDGVDLSRAVEGRQEGAIEVGGLDEPPAARGEPSTTRVVASRPRPRRKNVRGVCGRSSRVLTWRGRTSRGQPPRRGEVKNEGRAGAKDAKRRVDVRKRRGRRAR